MLCLARLELTDQVRNVYPHVAVPCEKPVRSSSHLGGVIAASSAWACFVDVLAASPPRISTKCQQLRRQKELLSNTCLRNAAGQKVPTAEHPGASCGLLQRPCLEAFTSLHESFISDMTNYLVGLILALSGGSNTDLIMGSDNASGDSYRT